MKWNLLFFFNSALLGVGLAMDAFSVSLANGLHEPFNEKEKNVRDCRDILPFPGGHANDRMDLRPHHIAIF